MIAGRPGAGAPAALQVSACHGPARPRGKVARRHPRGRNGRPGCDRPPQPRRRNGAVHCCGSSGTWPGGPGGAGPPRRGLPRDRQRGNGHVRMAPNRGDTGGTARPRRRCGPVPAGRCAGARGASAC